MLYVYAAVGKHSHTLCNYLLCEQYVSLPGINETTQVPQHNARLSTQLLTHLPVVGVSYSLATASQQHIYCCFGL